MAKRFLVSLLLVVLIVAIVAVGATIYFRGSYDSLTMLQAQASAQAEAARQDDAADAAVTVMPSSDPAPSAEVAAPAVSARQEDMESVLRAKVMLSNMTLEEKICQMMFVTPEALTGYNLVTQSGEVTRVCLQEYPVGGIIYFSSNLVTADQTRTMIDNIQNYSRAITGIGLFIGVDEEGGSVSRLSGSLGTTEFEDMAVYGAQGDARKAYEIGFTLASDMRPLGFNVDFAPVADVLTNDENTVVQDRSFGSDPNLVSEMITQEVRGFVDGGVLCAPKHFPGHGSTGGDTHDGFAATDRTLQELYDCDLKPFQAAITAGAPMIMVGHMTMTAIDAENPASLSSAVVTGLLRDQLGYDGVVITDALNMSAITDQYTSGEAAVKAVAAGCDMLLCVSNLANAVSALEEAVESGEITEARIDESVTRILAAKISYGVASN